MIDGEGTYARNRAASRGLAGGQGASGRAHHQCGRVGDAARARELGAALADLRLSFPGRREGALDHVQQHLRQLQTQT
ncbi:hypothetical protein C4B68_19375 [Streptomyces dengpaensis]|uniref:Uncharacterized protein n=1 Tax=Streptomyces dengpaensis TaxID=2049881 RepID=A0ABN5I3K3_9ACTN|nr:hypothetical protein C4B68_19375 [Streptomyces dengpaensis]